MFAIAPHHAHQPGPLRRCAIAWGAVCIATLALASGPAQAQWKWRGKDGAITVSDRPPPRDVADKDILTRPAAARVTVGTAPTAASAASAPAASSGRSALDKEVEARRKAAEQEQAAKAKAEEAKVAAQKAENCQRARTQASTLESGIRLTRVNEKGEREVLDDSAREREMRLAREAIASDCR